MERDYLTGWGGISIVISDLDVCVSVRCGRLVVVVCVSGASSPCANTDVCLAVGKRSDKVLEGGPVLNGVDTGDIVVVIAVDAQLQSLPGAGIGSVPGIV